MAELPLEQAIPRFKTNEDRIDTFVNGDEDASYTTSGGVPVPSVRNWMNGMTEYLAGSPYRLPSFAALSRLTYGVATGSQIRVAAGDVVDVPGVGTYLVAASGVSDQHVTTAGSVKLYAVPGHDGRISLAAMGLALDGSDESVAAQAAFAKLKGRKIVIPAGKSLCAAGIYMNGSSWDGTDLLCEGDFKLAPAASAGANNGYGRVWSGIEARLCSVTINGNFDGNRANQQQRQQTICITLSGGNLRSDVLRFRELRGDGMYITQSEYNTASTDPTFDLGLVFAENTAADGRNIMSVISCARGTIDAVVSRNIGGVVGGVATGGGLDFEPNYSGQVARNVTIGYLDIESVSGSCLQIYGARYTDMAHTSYSTTIPAVNIQIGHARMKFLAEPNLNDGLGNLTHSSIYPCRIEGVRGVSIGWLEVESVNAYAPSLAILDGASDVYIRGKGVKSSQVVVGGGTSSETQRISENIDIVFDVTDVSRYGYYLHRVKNSRLSGRISNPTTDYYTSTYAVIAEYNAGQGVAGDLTNTVLSFDIPASAEWTRAWRTSGTVDYTDAVIDGARSTGSWASDTARYGDMQIKRRNSVGITTATAQPTGGYFLAGTFVENENAGALGEPDGWLRLVSSASHAAGTWRAIGASVFTQDTTYSGTLAHTATDETQIYSGTLTGAAVGDLIDVAPKFNPQGCKFRGVIPAANTLRIYGINQTGVDQPFANPSFTVRWEKG